MPLMASGPWVPAFAGMTGWPPGLLLGVEDLEGEEGGDYEVGDVD